MSPVEPHLRPKPLSGGDRVQPGFLFMSKNLKNRESDDLDFNQFASYPDHVPPGEYEATCYDAGIGYMALGVRKAFLWFRIISGEHEGKGVLFAANFPLGKKSFGSKIVKQWMFANCRQPRKGEKISLKSFLRRAYRIRVRDVKNTLSDGTMRPDFMNYSVVETIVRPLTGVITNKLEPQLRP